MRELLLLLLGYLLAVVQSTLAPALQIAGGTPDFVWMVVLYIVLTRERQTNMLWCWALGLMRDLLGNGPLGVYAFSMTLVGFLMVRFCRGLHAQNAWTRWVLLAISTLWVHAVVAVFAVIKGIPWEADWGTRLASAAALTATVGLPVFWVLDAIRRGLRSIESLRFAQR